MSPEQHAALITALRAIETKVDDAVKAAQGFEPRRIDTVKPAIAAPTSTTTTASTTANGPLHTDDGASSQPIELDGNSIPCPPETNAIKPSDTTEQNTNAIMDDKMSDNEESDNGESSHDTGHHKQDYRDPPPGWKPSDEYGWMDHLMPSPEDRVRDMMIEAPPIDRIKSIEKQLSIILKILDLHNFMLRGVIYVGAWLSLGLAIRLISDLKHEE